MKLRIVSELRVVREADNTCCFEYWENKAMRKCGHKALVTAGKDKYLCREHASYASQFVKDFLSELGHELTRSDFFSRLDQKYKELESE